MQVPPLYPDQPFDFSNPLTQREEHTFQTSGGAPDRHDARSPFMAQDVVDYIRAQSDMYEESKRRWENCSLEEWEKGADGTWPESKKANTFLNRECVEIVNKLAGILDSVRQILFTSSTLMFL